MSIEGRKCKPEENTKEEKVDRGVYFFCHSKAKGHNQRGSWGGSWENKSMAKRQVGGLLLSYKLVGVIAVRDDLIWSSVKIHKRKKDPHIQKQQSMTKYKIFKDPQTYVLLSTLHQRFQLASVSLGIISNSTSERKFQVSRIMKV